MNWKNKDCIRFTLRLPEDLHHRLSKKIENNRFGCSLNDYVLKALYRSLDQEIPM
jgi:predicted HicB family RNase H-like nuclease